MPITCWCKKCGKDVPVGDVCNECGSRLAKNTIRCAWMVKHTPVTDWFVWNSIMRIMLPAFLILLILVVILEIIFGGISGAAALLSSGTIAKLLAMFGICTALIAVILLLQGRDYQDCVVDSKGIHMQTYLPNPNGVKLLLRLKSPRIMEDMENAGEYENQESKIVLVSQQEILWKDIERVDCWTEKTTILVYKPSWWLYMALPCTPFTYVDALSIIKDKLGKKKKVTLPQDIMLVDLQEKSTSEEDRSAFVIPSQLNINDIPDVQYNQSIQDYNTEGQIGETESNENEKE